VFILLPAILLLLHATCMHPCSPLFETPIEEDFFNSGFAFSFFGKTFHNDLSGLTHVHGSTGHGMDNPRPDLTLRPHDEASSCDRPCMMYNQSIIIHIISSHPISSHLISFHLISFHLISSHLISSHRSETRGRTPKPSSLPRGTTRHDMLLNIAA